MCGSNGFFAPPITLYVDGRGQTIASIEEAMRFIRDHADLPQIASAHLLLNVMEAGQTEGDGEQAWRDFAMWAFIAGLTKSETHESPG